MDGGHCGLLADELVTQIRFEAALGRSVLIIC